MTKGVQILRSTGGRIGLGLLSALIGFLVNIPIQNSQNSAIHEILIVFASSGINSSSVEGLNSIINKMNAPFSWQGLMFAVLFFFFTEFLIDMIFDKDVSTSKMSSDLNNENVLVNLLDHLKNECYSKCSNVSSHCSSCERFPQESDGLLRQYLYQESSHLQNSIKSAQQGKYDLDTNIEEYHTYAISHLIASKSIRYYVFQWIGSKEFNEQNPYEETYDRLDFHFLERLLTLLTNSTDENGKSIEPYYKHRAPIGKKVDSFRIQWILIGDKRCMKNNYDYIFRVIDALEVQMTVPKATIFGLFEFYVIDERNYRLRSEEILLTTDSLCRSLLSIDNQPSLGIFGSQFMFADSLDANRHGTIYSKTYHDGSSKPSLEHALGFFKRIQSYARKLDINDLYADYSDIINKDSKWVAKLDKIWHPDNRTK